MKKQIQTSLLNRTVTIRNSLHLHMWEQHEGKLATIESVYLNSEGTPEYTLSLPCGTLVEAYAWAFQLNPLAQG
jgi:hypothetical protein